MYSNKQQKIENTEDQNMANEQVQANSKILFINEKD